MSESRRELTAEEKQLLAEGGFESKPLASESQDPVELAAAEFAKLRRESFNTEAVARILGVTDGRIRQRLTGRTRTLLGIKVNGDWRIPRFQFDGDELVPGIERVIGRLRKDLNLVSIYRWFSNPNPDLAVGEEEDRQLTPLQWLRTGCPVEVVAELAADL